MKGTGYVFLVPCSKMKVRWHGFERKMTNEAKCSWGKGVFVAGIGLQMLVEQWIWKATLRTSCCQWRVPGLEQLLLGSMLHKRINLPVCCVHWREQHVLPLGFMSLCSPHPPLSAVSACLSLLLFPDSLLLSSHFSKWMQSEVQGQPWWLCNVETVEVICGQEFPTD